MGRHPHVALDRAEVGDQPVAGEAVLRSRDVLVRVPALRVAGERERRGGGEPENGRDDLPAAAVPDEHVAAREHGEHPGASGEGAVQERRHVRVEVRELGAPADRAEQRGDCVGQRPQQESVGLAWQPAAHGPGHEHEHERRGDHDRLRGDEPQDVLERLPEPVRVEVVRRVDLADVDPEPAVGGDLEQRAPAEADHARAEDVARQPPPVDDEDDQAAEGDVQDAGLLAEEREREDRPGGRDAGLAAQAPLAAAPAGEGGERARHHEQEERVGADQVVPALDVRIAGGEQAEREQDRGDRRRAARVLVRGAAEAGDRDHRDPDEADQRDRAPERVRQPDRRREQREHRGVERRVEVRDEVDRRRHVDALAVLDPQRVVEQAALHPLEVVRVEQPARDRGAEQDQLPQRGQGDHEPRQREGDPGGPPARRHGGRGRGPHGSTWIVATATPLSRICACGAVAGARRAPLNSPAHTVNVPAGAVRGMITVVV